MDQIVIIQLGSEHKDILDFYDKINKIYSVPVNDLPKILIFDNYKNVKNCSILKENKKDVKCVKKIFSNFDIMKYEPTNFQEL